MRGARVWLSGAVSGMDGVGVFKDGDDGDGARIGDRRRDSLFMIAQLRLAGADTVHEVRVRNLSVGGLMIEFDRDVAVGAGVMLEMRGLGEVKGRVAWCTRGRVARVLVMRWTRRAIPSARASRWVSARRRATSRHPPFFRGRRASQRPDSSSFSRNFCFFRSAITIVLGIGRPLSSASRWSRTACLD